MTNKIFKKGDPVPKWMAIGDAEAKFGCDVLVEEIEGYRISPIKKLQKNESIIMAKFPPSFLKPILIWTKPIKHDRARRHNEKIDPNRTCDECGGMGQKMDGHPCRDCGGTGRI